MMAASSLLSSPQERRSSLGETSLRSMSSSCNTSGSSTASEVLKKSSAPSASGVLEHGRLNPSDSSINSSRSSTGSVRVRIKAKYLKERKSPFEQGKEGSQGVPYLPPALPANLPADYEAQREVADVHRLDSNDVMLNVNNSHHSRVSKPADEQTEDVHFQPSPASQTIGPMHLASRFAGPSSGENISECGRN